MFKRDDKIDYGFYKDLKVVGEDEKHYILRDRVGNLKKVYKSLVNEYGKLIEQKEISV